MNKKLIFSRLIIFLVLLMLPIYIYGNFKKANTMDNSNASDKETQEIYADTNNLSAWVVYWDLKTDKEIQDLDKKLKNICYFAASYNSNNELVMPEDLINYYNESKNYNQNKYITIVNDKKNNDGSNLLKDTNLLKALLNNKESRNRHIEEIINLAVKNNFNGIEIDYEQMKNDINLWNDYILFISELYQKAEKNNLKLRILLEANTPIDKLDFTEGPTYVMMCYNLHGGFSKPGGKASPEFIRSLIEKMSKVPGKKDFAIASGGFDWASNGKTTSVTEAEAYSLLKKYKAKGNRDAVSQCLFFKYKDENNVNHEIWYADKITLNSWIKVIAEKGYDVSIWRLDGNSL